MVTLSEPIRYREYGGMDSPPSAAARIRDFAEEARERLRAERRAPSVQVGGRLDDNRTAESHTEAGLRRFRGGWGEIEVRKCLPGRFGLLIKHNALFAALLPRLTGTFTCLALVRTPLPVLASWQTVALPVHRGRVPAGETFDPDLHRRLEEDTDVPRRPIIVLDWVFARYDTHLAPEDIIRYEDLAESGGRAHLRRLGHPVAAPVALESRNDSALYAGARVESLLKPLLDADRAWARLYRSEELEEVVERIRRGPLSAG